MISRKLKSFICQKCGQTVLTTAPNLKTCAACKANAKAKGRRKNLLTLACVICGAEFQSSVAHAKYCGPGCRGQGRLKTKICADCGGEFVTAYGKARICRLCRDKQRVARGQFRKQPDPTPEEIRERIHEVQAAWDDQTEKSRQAIPTPDEWKPKQVTAEAGDFDEG